ncbi:hypothetical protein J4N45_10170 [Vibrio sp. SCSIO 43140]|uniref:hypothetical protein n=1 Tax=Vibrio sp. SCSIO 43140 TaxID=2819100 RepID=UPI0020760990|nr:hypothetical protein [Vibrio sp. SCSIO 43140]USD58895.1 hypothetical protein J4N45_10170 [Vibrio sp. SCSIO 43140]
MIVEQSLPQGLNIEQLNAMSKRKEKYRLKTAAFLEWQHKLNRNDTLPRGRFFRNKRPGPPVLAIDEAHRYYSGNSFPQIHETLTLRRYRSKAK